MTTKTIYFHAQLNEYADSGVRWWVNGFEDMTGYVLVGTAEVELPELDHDALVAGTIKQLRKEKEQIYAEAEVKAKNIQDLIDRLLALEHKG